MSYDQVRRELQAGTPPELVCATCPWSRPCVTPPELSTAEVERRIADASAKDSGNGEGAFAATLITAMALGGRDTMGDLCPVFAARFTGPDGRKIADGLRAQMQQWGES